MFTALFSLMVFVTDCDNTLVHYDSSETHGGIVHTQKVSSASEGELYLDGGLISMPASSGSGKISSVSAMTLAKLDEIAAEGVEIICATGMRASTMLQREKFFPSIKYWACENGGRIFHREKIGEPPVEIADYSNAHDSNIASLRDLKTFTETLTSAGYEVDDKGYLTMIRVKGANLQNIIPQIPDTLRHTFNLGYLDIQCPGYSKLSAARWIIANRLKKASLFGPLPAYPSGHPSTADELSAEHVATAIDSEAEDDFLFMGDDDNDIDIAAAADTSFITKPCSGAMQNFIDNYRSGEDMSRVAKVKTIHEAPFLRHRGTESLLAGVLDIVKTRKSMIAQEL